MCGGTLFPAAKNLVCSFALRDIIEKPLHLQKPDLYEGPVERQPTSVTSPAVGEEPTLSSSEPLEAAATRPLLGGTAGSPGRTLQGCTARRRAQVPAACSGGQLR